jgi:hypothetical protein
MGYNICGIEITNEHADRIIKTVKRIDWMVHPLNPRNAEIEAAGFWVRYREAQRTNPHNEFQGTAFEYVRRYLPEKMHLLEYL